jgi:hypothetical protein
MTAEWRDASESGRKPRWSIFTDTYIKQVCDQVAMSNPEWNRDLYETDLSRYLVGTSTRSMWWILPGSGASAVHASNDSAYEYLYTFIWMLIISAVTVEEPDASPVLPVPSTSSTSPIFASSAASEAAPPPPTAPTGLLTRAAKSKMHTVVVEVPRFKAFNATAGPSTAPYELRKKRPREPVIEPPDVIIDSSSDEISEFSPDDTPWKATEVPPGLTVPRVRLDITSPPRPAQNLPFSTGMVFTHCHYDFHLLLTSFTGYVWALLQKWANSVQCSRRQIQPSQNRLCIMQ